MKVEWLSEARNEFREFLQYYRTEVGIPYAEKFAGRILSTTEQLAQFPEMGVLKYDTLMGKHGFRALFIDHYVCVYKVDSECRPHLSSGGCAKKLYLSNLWNGVTRVCDVPDLDKRNVPNPFSGSYNLYDKLAAVEREIDAGAKGEDFLAFAKSLRTSVHGSI